MTYENWYKVHGKLHLSLQEIFPWWFSLLVWSQPHSPLFTQKLKLNGKDEYLYRTHYVHVIHWNDVMVNERWTSNKRTTIRYVTSGGVVGIMISFKYIANRLPPAYAKIFFVSTWASFAYALYLLNRAKDRPIKMKVPDCPNVRALLFFTGIIGGIFTGIAGSGLDICSFCVLIMSYKWFQSICKLSQLKNAKFYILYITL